METIETKKPSKHMQAALNQLTKQVEWFERKRAKLQDEVTAREKETPDYVKDKPQSTKDIIRSQKDVPFLADIIIHLKKVIGVNQTKYWGHVIKLSGLSPPSDLVESMTFEKLIKLIDEQEKKLEVKKDAN